MLTSIKAVVVIFGVEALFGAAIVGLVALMSSTVAGWVAVVFGAVMLLQLLGVALSGLLAKTAAKRAGALFDELDKQTRNL